MGSEYVLSLPARSRLLDSSQEDGESWTEIGEGGHSRRAEQHELKQRNWQKSSSI